MWTPTTLAVKISTKIFQTCGIYSEICDKKITEISIVIL